MNDQTPVLELRNLSRSFKQGSQMLQVLRNVELEIEKG